jgi:hypothetical protein
MLYSEIIAVCSHTHTKHINTLCGQNAEFLYFKPGGLKYIRGLVVALDQCPVMSLRSVSMKHLMLFVYHVTPQTLRLET